LLFLRTLDDWCLKSICLYTDPCSSCFFLKLKYIKSFLTNQYSKCSRTYISPSPSSMTIFIQISYFW
jgi:hypothetical protein